MLTLPDVVVAGFADVVRLGRDPLNVPDGFAVVLPAVPVPLDGVVVVGFFVVVVGFLPVVVVGLVVVVGRPCDTVPVEGLVVVTEWPEVPGFEGFGVVVTLWPEWFVVPVFIGVSLLPVLYVRPLYQLLPPLLLQLCPPRYVV